MGQYSFSTDNDTVAAFMRRTTKARAILHEVSSLLRPGKVTLTDVQIFLDPEEVDNLIGQLRAEVDLIAETLGHMLDRNV